MLEVTTIELPLEVVKSSAGFGLDIGGSTAKLIYRSKQDYENGIPKDENAVKHGKGKVCMVQVERENIDDLVTYIQDHCDLSKTEEGQDVIAYSTGFGGQQFQEKIEKGLKNIKMKNLTEFNCFVNALCLMLRELPAEELFLPVNEAGVTESKRMLEVFKQFKQAVDEGANMDLKSDENSTEEEDDDKEFPFILAVLGSGLSLLRVEEEGKFSFVEGSSLCGRFFHGLAYYLTSEKDFPTICHLIEESDGRSVDTWSNDLIKDAPSGDDMYSSLSNIRLFPFGKGLTEDRDSAKKGDLVNSLLQSMCDNVGRQAYAWCRLEDVKKLYITGNFINIPKAQQFLTESLYGKKHSQEAVPFDFEFVRYGGYLGGIGTLLETHRMNQLAEVKTNKTTRL